MPRALLFTAALLVIAPLSADATPFSGCGTLIQGVECLLFQTDQSGTYFLGNYGTFKAGDHVFVTGDAHVCFTACVEGIACITGNTIQICGTHAPSVSAPGDVSGVEGASLSFSVTATDPDGIPIAALTAQPFLLPAGNDAQFTVDPSNTSGTFTWTPTSGDARVEPYMVFFTATAQGLSSLPTLTRIRVDIAADAELAPRVLNTGSLGRVVTGYVELPARYSPFDIDVSTIRVDGTVPALSKPSVVGDHDLNGISDLMVKFDRTRFGYLTPGRHDLEVTGSLTSGTRFEGTAPLVVTHPAAPSGLSLTVTSRPGAVPVEFTIQDRSGVAHVSSVFDIQGRLLRRWSSHGEDVERLSWDGRDAAGSCAPSGMYFIRVVGNGSAGVARVVVVR